MKIVFTPDWFLTHDVLIEIFSFMILLLFFLLSWKAYKLNNKKSTLFLGVGFLLIAIAELSTIFTKFVLYYDTTVVKEVGRVIVTYQVVNSVDIFYHIGFFFNKFLTLLGLYVIYKMPKAEKITSEFFLIIYLMAIVAILSYHSYFFYHITAILLLLAIIGNYYNVYKRDKLLNTKILISAFTILAISQLIFLFAKLGYFYVIAQNLQLVSYAILLILITKILKNGPKKKQSRHRV